MKKYIEKVEQRGTLLVEAIAMLGLIAMVTPTLYKKSAERLQEIQDINAASQMRTFNQIIETFVSQKMSTLKDEMGEQDVEVMEIVKNDSSGGGAFSYGYSSVMPFGYRTDEIKNYEEPRVFAHFNKTEQSSGALPTMTTYIIYPHIADPGKKRAARLASLVGANGGMVLKNKEMQGTGGAWFLDDSQIASVLEIPDELLTENNIVVTSQEPIEESTEDNPKFLYRIFEGEGDVYRNAMTTNLYMGGMEDPSGHGSEDYYSIFNVRKLTLNTKCDYTNDVKSGNYSSAVCDPEVADLYIGKPVDRFANLQDPGEKGLVPANNGAAWIYGNLTAMNEGFKVFSNSSATEAKFLFHPTAVTNNADDSAMAEYALIDAELNSSVSHVKFIGDFVKIVKGNGAYQFTITPEDSSTSNNDVLFHAQFSSGSTPEIYIGQHKNSDVYIAEQGGRVYINAGSSDVADEFALTKVNTGGGELAMGHEAGWMHAYGKETSTSVHMLLNGGSTFTVGENDVDKALFYGKYVGGDPNSSLVSVNQGRLYLEPDNNNYTLESNLGGVLGSGHSTVVGRTTVATNYVDILGKTYIGAKEMQQNLEGDSSFARHFALGVAGSAWVDDLLWARKAWVGDMGTRDFHAGFSSFASYHENPKKGWFNVYNPSYSNDIDGGGVVIRNPNLVSSNVLYNEKDVMFLTRSGEARVSDTKGAELSLLHGETKLGSIDNYFYADSSDTSSLVGSSLVVGKSGVGIYTSNSDASSGVVSLQNGAFELYGHPDLAGGNHNNKIIANAQKFALRTGSSLVESDEDNVQFYVDDKIARYRDVDFAVQRLDSTSVFEVNIDPSLAKNSDSTKSNIEIDGSIHVTGNEVIHIASNSTNSAVEDGQHAMFEIDPNYIRVWAKDKVNNSFAGSSATNYYSMLEINPYDVDGTSITDTRMNDTSIYIRKGAIEFMKSDSSLTNGAGVAADAGFGYIKANRLVSNAGTIPISATSEAGIYDQYMVNPAYTSVMHDIKLTTRGGARLSDVLPDFVLKGVYNVSNDFVEEGSVNTLPNRRIGWSAGDACGKNGISCVSDNVAWASPYLGKIPFAMCPPGYANMATIVPISFQLGKAGRVVPASAGTKSKWMVSEPTQQADILNYANSARSIWIPAFEKIESFAYNDIVDFGNGSAFSSFDNFVGTMSTVTEGWFYGLPADKNNISSQTSVELVQEDRKQFWKYKDAEGVEHPVASPLYFQEGTFLKTTVKPNSAGYWEGRMGFIYDKNVWGDVAGGLDNEGILSNNTITGNDTGGGNGMQGADYVWNLFPVPTNTLEGHATVYCYFDRTKFADKTADQVQQLNMMDAGYNFNSKQSSGAENAEAYIKRLHDPSLMYNDPW